MFGEKIRWHNRVKNSKRRPLLDLTEAILPICISVAMLSAHVHACAVTIYRSFTYYNQDYDVALPYLE